MADTQTLPAMVRAKFPGVYDDISDADLDSKVRAKYPGVYDDLAKPSATSTAPSPGSWEKRGMAGDVWHPAGATGAKAMDPELGRVDNSLLGMPPEMAALSAMAVTRAAAVPAANLMGRAKAAMVAAGAQAAPQLKYEVTKSALQGLGVPAPFAMAAALMVSGYRKGGGKATPAAETPLPEGVDRYMPNVSTNQAIQAPPIAQQQQASAASMESPGAALASRVGTPSDTDLVKALIAKGNSASAAIQTIARGDPKKFGRLMTAYMQARQVK